MNIRELKQMAHKYTQPAELKHIGIRGLEGLAILWVGLTVALIAALPFLAAIYIFKHLF